MRIVRTACQACHCECGVLVYVEGEKVMKIEGDPDHPVNEGMLCPKGLAYTQLLYHPDRLKYPLKRAGERGKGKWQRISWNEALDTIASKLKEIIDQYGPKTIAASYGTGPRPSIISTFALCRSLGSPNTSCTDFHYCFAPSVIAEYFTYGAFTITQEIGPDFRNSKCILVWGANPLATHPPIGRDIIKAWSKGAKLIVVDPRFTPLASKADLWLQVRPATDDALALGMLNVIINEELYDKEFVNKWCMGFGKLKKRVQEYPPERVSEITWIRTKDIKEAARMYATIKPASLHHRVAIEMHTNSVQTLRALAIMIAITGNLDIKGGNVIPSPPSGYIGRKPLCYGKEFRGTEETERERVGAKEFPLLSGPESPIGGAYPQYLVEALLTGKPYPIKAWFATNNVVLALQNARKVYEAFKNLELFVVIEFFMTPTAELADIVLPAATWLERDEICDHFIRTNLVYVRQKTVEPVGECWDEHKIVFEILKRLGAKFFANPDVKSLEDYNNWLLKPIGISFEDLKKEVVFEWPAKYKKYEDQGFNTPSGRVELYSSVFEKFGYDPLPYYEENPESPLSTPELYKENPLILITGGRHIAYFHSMGRQIPWLREIRPDPIIEIHPDTAQKLGIGEGDWVWIETPRCKGRARQKAKLTYGIHPEVVHAETQWWFPERGGPDYGIWESNINIVITDEPPYDPICGAVPLRGCLCKVYKEKSG